MSFLDRFFDPKGNSPPSIIQAIQKLRETEDLLVKKQEHLESKMEREFLIAKKNASNNKQVAIQALKRKKRYEEQLRKIDGTLTTIEIQREALEGANTTTTVLKTMKNAAEALKRAHFNLDVDKVNNILDDIADQHELANDISNAISTPVAFEQNFDEDELEKELEALNEDSLEEKLLDVPQPSEFAEVSTTTKAKFKKASKVEAESDEDVRKLEQWAS